MNLIRRISQTLLFDLDNTLASSGPYLMQKINSTLGTSYTTHDVIYYTWIWDLLRKHLNPDMTDDELMEFAYGEDVLKKAKPIPGAPKLIKDLSDAGFHIKVSTSRPWTQRGVTLATLEEYFPDINLNQVYMREEHHASKFEAKLRSLIDCIPLIFLDDDADLLLRLVGWVSPSVNFGVMDWPWNKYPIDPQGEPRPIEANGERFRRLGDYRHIDVSPSPWVRDYKRWLNELTKN